MTNTELLHAERKIEALIAEAMRLRVEITIAGIEHAGGDVTAAHRICRAVLAERCDLTKAMAEAVAGEEPWRS